MRSPLWGLALALAATTLVTAAGGDVGELTSDSPVEVHGTGVVPGHPDLIHYAFRDGSLGGVTYAGRVFNRTHLDVEDGADARCFEEYDDRDYYGVQAVALPESRDARIEFHLQQGALARLGFREDFRFRIENNPVPADEARSRFAVLGPNPYVYAAPPEGQTDHRQAPALPTSAFLVLPDGPFQTDSGHSMVVHWGTFVLTQRGETRELRAGESSEYRPLHDEFPPPLPGQPPTQCRLLVTETLVADHDLTTLAVDQSGLDKTIDYYQAKLAFGAPPDPEPAPVKGTWPRVAADSFDGALEAYRLPATIITNESLALDVDGSATFARALGSLSVGGRFREAREETVALTGRLELAPDSAADEGRRMRTQIGNKVSDVALAGAPEGAPWLAYAGGATVGVAAAAAAYWAWPTLRFGGTRLLLFPLYARLKREDVLENPVRDDILEVVATEPGISASELGRRLECGWGTLVYHLTVLERMQLISSAREGRHKRFFVQGRINYSDKTAVGLLANAAARNILQAVQEHPGTIQKDVARLLGLTPGTVAWHVERLSAAGLVIKEEDGRVVRYYPSQKLAELTRQLGA